MVHEHDLGAGGRAAGWDRRRDPVAVDAEGRAARCALRERARAVRPRLAVIDRLPNVRLQGRDALAAREVAEVDRVRLVSGEAVVSTARVGRRHLGPRGALVRRRVRDRSAARRRVVKLPKVVRYDRRLPAVGADVHHFVSRRRSRLGRARRDDHRRRGHGGQSALAQVTHEPTPPEFGTASAGSPTSPQSTYQGAALRTTTITGRSGRGGAPSPAHRQDPRPGPSARGRATGMSC